MYFSLFLLLIKAKNHENHTYYKTSIKMTLKEKEVDWLGASQTQE